MPNSIIATNITAAARQYFDQEEFDKALPELLKQAKEHPNFKPGNTWRQHFLEYENKIWIGVAIRNDGNNCYHVVFGLAEEIPGPQRTLTIQN